jgi:integrase
LWIAITHGPCSKRGCARLFLSPPLREVLARRMAARRLDTPLVFHYDDGKPIGDWRKVWKRACREAGLPGKLFHDLRRTCARNLIQSGVPEAHAMKVTGHKTRSVFDRYNITSEVDERTASAKLAAHVRTLEASPVVVPIAKAAEGGRRTPVTR